MVVGLGGASEKVRRIGRNVATIGLAGMLTFGCGSTKDDDANDGGSGGDGSGASGGGGGSSGSYATRMRTHGNGKFDILLMIDNSIGMADKQWLLADSIPVLLNRLAMQGIEDVHIGVITSSLGHHGSKDVCSDWATNPSYDDRAQLLPSVRANPPLRSWDSSGFLAWDPGAKKVPPGTSMIHEISDDLARHIQGVGEVGCGYEASLEAWYRFLVDPEPVGVVDNLEQKTLRGTPNEVVLAQRERFLRGDSHLVIAMLSDENDCSIIDETGSFGWLVGFKGGPTVNNWRMPRATASCADPNSACCRPCSAAPEPGCPDNAEEGCVEGNNLTIEEDSMNLRCFRQKERFGVDMLYPTSRYVDALTKPMIDPRLDGRIVSNPLFTPTIVSPARSMDMVTFLGIVGVPWQDLADTESLTSPRRLRFLTAAELEREGRWPIILGDPATGTPPQDPHMIESIEPRPTGTPHPLVANAEIRGPETTTLANAVNGHEMDTSTQRNDLQYACIFPLGEPIPCTAANNAGCECNEDEEELNSPLCRYPAPGAAGTQEYAKAYPSVRILEVMRALGERSVSASICPKNIEPAPGSTTVTDPDFGYTPALLALSDRLAASQLPSCLSRPLASSSTSDGDRIACSVLESAFADDGTCACDESQNRYPLTGLARSAAERIYEQNGLCGAGAPYVCDLSCMCEIRQLEGDDLVACQNDVEEPSGVSGFCYVDGASENANPELVQHCEATSQRRIRVLGTARNPRTQPTLVCRGG